MEREFVEAYPVHLHINLDQEFRGRGIGGSLITTFLHQARERGQAGVHLATTSPDAKGFFARHGCHVARTARLPPLLGKAARDVCLMVLPLRDRTSAA